MHAPIRLIKLIHKVQRQVVVQQTTHEIKQLANPKCRSYKSTIL